MIFTLKETIGIGLIVLAIISFIVFIIQFLMNRITKSDIESDNLKERVDAFENKKQYDKDKYNNIVCPYCHETRRFNFETRKGISIGGVHRTWYGKQFEYLPNKIRANWIFFTPIKYWGEPCRHWEIQTAFCYTCDFSWELPAHLY